MGEAQGLRHRIAPWCRAGFAPVALLGVAALTASAVAQATVPPVVPPAVAPAAGATGFQTILWIRDGAHDDAFFAAVAKAGFRAVSVTGGQDPASPATHGLGFYRDQICGKGVLELRDEEYRKVADAYARVRDEAVLVRPAVLSAPATVDALTRRLDKGLAAVLPHRPLAISLGDEVAVTRHANPLDLCFAPASLDAFRAFLATRYTTVDRLDQVWNCTFASFPRVRPFTADAIRSREFDGRTLPANLAPWADHREFMDAEFARIVGQLADRARARGADLPVGLTGLQPPSAYGGHDYARLLPHLTFFEAYDIGGARDLAACFAPTGARQIATLFPPAVDADPRLLTARLADMIAHGMWGTVVWSSDEVFGADGARTPYGEAVAVAFRTLGPAAACFAGADIVRSPVWMVESQASVRAWWMLDSRNDGTTWIKRLSSYEAKHSTSLAARHGWLRLLQDLGVQPVFVAEDALAARLAAEPPRILVLPAAIALSDPALTAIRAYVMRGGTLVADHTPALYDEHLVLRPKGGLDDLFGVTGRTSELDRILVHQGRALPTGRLASGPAAVEPGLGGRLADPVGGFRVQIENEQGTGRTCYLNLAVCEYGDVRLDPSRLTVALGLRKRVRHLLRDARVASPVLVQSRGMPTCLERVVLEGRDGRRLLAVRVHALESPAVLAEIAARGPHTVTVRFPRRTVLVDLLRGRELPEAMQHELPFDPYTGLFVEVRQR